MASYELVFTYSGQVSGGHLAVLDTAEETDWLRRHLVKHVALNIREKLCNFRVFRKNSDFLDPYETVTFFIGGLVDEV